MLNSHLIHELLHIISINLLILLIIVTLFFISLYLLFIAEIQQSSNITYRLYDYNRKDINGNGRELHTELAKDAIDFKMYTDLKAAYEPVENDMVPLVSCSYFTTNRIQLKADASGYEDVITDNGKQKVLMTETVEMDRDYSSLDSFVIYVCMQGEGNITYGDDQTISIHQGESVLLPACLDGTTLSTSGELLLLETYIL